MPTRSGASAASSASTATSRSRSGTGRPARRCWRATASACARSSSREYDGDVCFASEAKALLRHPAARRELDPVGIADTFVAWTTLPDRSAFVGIRELPPAHYVVLGPDGAGPETRWWDIDFSPVEADEDELVDEVEELLTDAIRIRLRADVQVGAYLSGGLDSSAIAAIAARQVGRGRLSAFGLGFSDERYDESAAQDAIAGELGVVFHRTVVDSAAIAEAFPKAVELAEKPMLRTAPAPLLRLAGAVREAGLKVVLTGEAADELFAGYDIFREDKVRRFWARDPSSTLRPLLFRRLNRWLATDPAQAGAFLTRFYAKDLEAVDDPLYSHRLRFENTARCLRMLSPELLQRAESEGQLADRLRAALPTAFRGLLAAREGAVRRDRDLLPGLPAAHAGRPDADGALDRGPVPVRRLPAGRARGPAARLAATARPAGEVRAAEGRRARASGVDPVAAEDPVSRAHPRRLLRAWQRPVPARARARARGGAPRTRTASPGSSRSSPTGARSARRTRWRSPARCR